MASKGVPSASVGKLGKERGGREEAIWRGAAVLWGRKGSCLPGWNLLGKSEDVDDGGTKLGGRRLMKFSDGSKKEARLGGPEKVRLLQSSLFMEGLVRFLNCKSHGGWASSPHVKCHFP